MSKHRIWLYCITLAMSVVVLTACSSGKTIQTEFYETYADSIEYEYINVTPEVIATKGNLHQTDHSCYTSRSDNDTEYVYRVGAGDRIFVKLAVINSSETYRDASGSDLTYILPQPHITQDETSFEVDSEGYLHVPYANPIKAAGEKLSVIHQRLHDEFRRYIARPFVEVKVHKYSSRFVNVQGQVGTPGRLAIDHIPMTVTRALHQSGGVSDDADLRHVFVQTSTGERKYIDLFQLLHLGRLEYNLLLEDGDTLVVPYSDGNQVYVAGEVVDRKIVKTHSRPLSLTEALLTANGPHPFAADSSAVYVIRSPEINVSRNALDPCVNRIYTSDQYEKAVIATSKLTVFHFDLSHPELYALSNRFDLANNDVVYVATRPITDWHRFIVQTLPANIGHWTDPRTFK